MSEQHSELRNIVEAALLAAEEPLSVSALASLFPEDAKPSAEQLKEVFEQLDRDYEGRGVELRRVGKGYRFQTREKYSPWLRKLSEGRPPRYSRAFLETLAIIAYRQPVTRGDIEEIRGVTVSSDIMRQLLDRDWVKEVGHRDVPGRPALLATTQQFLEYFNLEALGDLPPLLERREPADIARELNFRLPLDDDQPDSQAVNQQDEQEVGQEDGQEEDQAVDQKAAQAEPQDEVPAVPEADNAANDQPAPDDESADEQTGEEEAAASQRQDEGPAGLEAGSMESAQPVPGDESADERAGEEETAASESQDEVVPAGPDAGGTESAQPAPGDESADEQAGEEEGAASESEDKPAADPRPRAQVIPIDDALNSREGDGEAS